MLYTPTTQICAFRDTQGRHLIDLVPVASILDWQIKQGYSPTASYKPLLHWMAPLGLVRYGTGMLEHDGVPAVTAAGNDKRAYVLPAAVYHLITRMQTDVDRAYSEALKDQQYEVWKLMALYASSSQYANLTLSNMWQLLGLNTWGKKTYREKLCATNFAIRLPQDKNEVLDADQVAAMLFFCKDDKMKFALLNRVAKHMLNKKNEAEQKAEHVSRLLPVTYVAPQAVPKVQVGAFDPSWMD